MTLVSGTFPNGRDVQFNLAGKIFVRTLQIYYNMPQILKTPRQYAQMMKNMTLSERSALLKDMTPELKQQISDYLVLLDRPTVPSRMQAIGPRRGGRRRRSRKRRTSRKLRKRRSSRRRH